MNAPSWKNYFRFCLVWIAAWQIPVYLGAWYDDHFNLYQAFVQIITLVCMVVIVRSWQWQYIMLGVVLACQASYNFYDVKVYISSAEYAAVAGWMTAAEAFLLFIVGGARCVMAGRIRNPLSIRYRLVDSNKAP